MADYDIPEIGIPPAVVGFSSSILYKYIRNKNTYKFSLAGNISTDYNIVGVSSNISANSCLFTLSSLKTPNFSYILQGGTQSVGNVSYLSMGLNKTYAVSAFSLGIRRGQVGQLYPRGEHAKLKLPYWNPNT
jgi:hypothetical protein